MLRFLVLLCVLSQLCTGFSSDLSGTWTIIKANSSSLTLWESVEVVIGMNEPVEVNIIWKACYAFNQTFRLPRDGKAHPVMLTSSAFPTNGFLGVQRDTTTPALQTLTQASPASIVINEDYKLLSSQKANVLNLTHAFTLGSSSLMTYTIKSQTPPMVLTYEFQRKTNAHTVHHKHEEEGTEEEAYHPPQAIPKPRPGSKTQRAYVMYVPPNWTLNGGLASNALVIALQGLVNRKGPNFYIVYPPKWAFTYSPEVLHHYATKRGFDFTNLTSAQHAIATFRESIKGYVVWDTTVRSSLVVAFTVCGLYDAIPIVPSMVPLMKAFNISEVADFSTRFRNQTDLEIYTWAKKQYWHMCNRTSIVWMGGSCHNEMRPGVADWGVMTKSFFTDLSTVPSSDEYPLAASLLEDMAPTKFISFGWHSYCKDQEHTYVTLLSHHGGRAHGLNTLPDLSFINRVPISEGFKFKNHHNTTAPPKVPPNKVLVGLVQTDGLGLGAWTRPGRGKLPYAWEAGPDDYTLQGSLMEWFYQQATPNDYFVGALSGPGYLYPKVQPKEDLTKLLQLANQIFQDLDLDIMTIFDASAVPAVCGTSAEYKVDTTLTPEAVSAYFDVMSGLSGFMNGYGASYTFVYNETTKKSLQSFDYYLDPGRAVDDAVNDLRLLAMLNSRRPYYLIIHVREFSTIDRVDKIIAKLGPEFDIVHLDYLIRVANAHPTWRNHYNL